jgi:hypothetical protein
MSVLLLTLRGLACGGTLSRLDGENYVCEECGEVFNLKGLYNMELDLEEFDRLLLYSLKKRPVFKKHVHVA